MINTPSSYMPTDPLGPALGAMLHSAKYVPLEIQHLTSNAIVETTKPPSPTQTEGKLEQLTKGLNLKFSGIAVSNVSATDVTPPPVVGSGNISKTNSIA
jgi:hypothetical protein